VVQNNSITRLSPGELGEGSRDWRRLEEELREDISNILESITDAFVAVDADWRFTYVNGQAERIYSMRRVDMLGKDLWELFPEVAGTAFEREYRRAVRERVPLRLEEMFQPLGRWFEVLIYPARSGGLDIYFRDISLRKQSAAIVEGQKQALELALGGAPLESILEVLTRTVEAQSVDSVLASILLMDGDGQHLRHGAGPSLPEGYNRAIDGIAIGPRVGSCGTAACTGQPIVVSDIETDPLWADFRGLALGHGLRACWSTPILSSQRKVLGTFALYYREPREPAPRDREVVETLLHTAAIVIERRNEARERELAAERLREADRRKDEFLATLAHELRNPLAPIRNALHVLRISGATGGPAVRVQEMMERQVNHLVRLVDELLEISRITRGKIELSRDRVDLAAVLQHAIDISQPHIDEAGHRLILDLPPEPLPLDADPVRLAQVFANLLDNAARFTDPGGRITVSVAREGREGDTVRLSVADTGIGISAEMLPRVFELFAQDRSPGRAHDGLGIGLTLARSLVEMHGGSIEAHSEGAGMGSELVVRLPLLREQAPGEDAEPAERPALAAHRILLIDDNRDAADSLGMLLELLGAEVRTVYDGPAALAALATGAPTAVLLDIGMPDMDGYEVARHIRSEPRLKGVPLIALTGWGQEEDRRRARAAGFDHHLVKPVDIDALQALLTSL
jgi:PAS domain S-box-containing protein